MPSLQHTEMINFVDSKNENKRKHNEIGDMFQIVHLEY